MSLQLGFCHVEPLFYCSLGNLQKMGNSEVIEKIVDPFDKVFQWVRLQNPDHSCPIWPSKSAFQVSMATELKFLKCVEF